MTGNPVRVFSQSLANFPAKNCAIFSASYRVLLRVMNYPCCVNRDIQPIMQYSSVLLAEKDRNAGYL